MVLARGDSLGFAGLSCGIDYDGRSGQGVDVLGWTFCGDWEFPNWGEYAEWDIHLWPAAGSGSRMTWNHDVRCQDTVLGADGAHALAGVFYVYAYGGDTFSVTENNGLDSAPELQVADCMNNIYFLDPREDVGYVQFSNAPMLGFNPCTKAGTPPGTLPPPPEPPQPPPPPPGPPPPPTEAQDAAIVLHIGDANPRVACDGYPASAEDVVTAAGADPEGLPYYVYVLGSPRVPENWDPEIYEYHPGLYGLQFGIEYGPAGEGDGIRVFSWQSCAESALTGEHWPEAGSGITLTWGEHCRTSALSMGGYFYVAAYSPAVMSVTPFPGKASVSFADCSNREGDFAPLDIHRVGWLSMGGAAMGLNADGCNPLLGPCSGPTAVKPTTWGRLKTKFTNEN
jgi:hypothetical protein